VEVSNVVIKVPAKANTKGVCRLGRVEKVLEISDVRKRAESAREAERPGVRGARDGRWPSLKLIYLN